MLAQTGKRIWSFPMRMRILLRCAVLAGALLVLASCNSGGNGGKTSVRVVNASMDYASVDLYLDDKRKLAAVGFETVSEFAKADAGDYTVEFRQADAAGALESLSEKFGTGDRWSYVVLGSTAHFQVLAIDETHKEADKGKALLRLINAADDAGALDVYLTDETAALTDVSPNFAGVPGDKLAQEGLVLLDKGSYRLRVTAAGSTSDLRLDRSGVTLASKGVYTLVVCGTPGGFLADAMLVPQRGAATLIPTDKARVRAVVGLDGGNSVSVNVAGTPLIQSTAMPALGDYLLVGAGTAAVTLAVDGTDVPVSNVQLAAGSDYSLVYTGTGSAVTQSVVADANRLPASGTFKIRLVNVMSALDEPLSMSVDFVPVLDAVGLGSAALSDAIDAVDNGRLDVTRDTTLSVLYSATSLTLDSRSVYTQVMFGSAASPTGVLRKDR
jgi:hypothetical protein